MILVCCLSDLINQWFRSWGFWWKKSSVILGIIVLVCVFFSHVPVLWLRHLLPLHPDTNIGATSMLITPLAICLGHLWKRGSCEILRPGHEGRSLREMTVGGPVSWTPTIRSPSLFPWPWNMHCTCLSHFQKLSPQGHCLEIVMWC